jgi:hypothetical protein
VPLISSTPPGFGFATLFGRARRGRGSRTEGREEEDKGEEEEEKKKMNEPKKDNKQTGPEGS